MTPTRWRSIEQRTASAFGLAGLLILASLVVPVGLEPVIGPSWAVGLVLVGLAVVATSIGLLGLYPRVSDSDPWLATLGVVGAVVAGGAALGLIGLAGIALVGEPMRGITVVDPIRLFMGLGLSMAGGFALGLLAFGAASWRAATPSRPVGRLLAIGGMALLIPVTIEVVGVGFDIQTPAWVLFPVIVVVALDALAIGYRLRGQTTELPA